MKQLSILAFEALPHEGVPSSKWHNEPAWSLSSAMAASLRGVLGSDLTEELGHKCPVYVDTGRSVRAQTAVVRPHGEWVKST